MKPVMTKFQKVIMKMYTPASVSNLKVPINSGKYKKKISDEKQNKSTRVA